MEKSLVVKPLVNRIELLTIYLGMYASSLVYTLIFPFANEMIIYFGVTSDRNATGFWVGLLASALMLGRVISSPIWGCIIDSWGRKPVTQLALASMAILCILFGISTSMIYALVIRFLLGVLTPLTISSKTLLSDLYKGQSMNSAMAWVSIAWNLGSISGSVFGGILSNPGEKDLISGGLFVDYPYLLANLVPSIVCIISLALGFVFLKETLVKGSVQEQGNNKTLLQIATQPQVYPLLFIQVVLGFSYTGFQELIALLSWAEADSGGLQLTTTQIGYLLGASNLLLLLFQRQLYVYLARVMGNIMIPRYGLFAAPFVSILVPLSGLIHDTYAKFTVLLFLCMLWFFLDFATNTATMVLMNESVHPEELGRLNGINVSMVCAIRMISPIAVGYTFALAIESWLPQPFNYSCGFYLVAIAQCVGLLFTFKIQSGSDNRVTKLNSEVELVPDFDEEIHQLTINKQIKIIKK